MASGDTLQGTRLPDAVMGEPGPGWDAWETLVDGVRRVTAPLGSYMKVELSDGRRWCWYVRAPNGDIGTLRDHHAITEFEDGTISASPSIVMPHGGRWHGFLERGVWREV